MDFSRQPRRSTVIRGNNDENLSVLYPHDLQLYSNVPGNQILLHDFEEMALERLKVLKAIETVSLRGFVRLSDEWRTNFMEELHKQGLKHLANLYSSPGNAGLKNCFELRRKDHISHFILSLAFCRTDELRQWFINKEITLFQTRFEYLSAEGLNTFLQINNFDFKPIPNKEKQAREVKLMDTFQNLKYGQFEKMDFYKVHFRRVPELVKSRRVLMERGMCYIAATDLSTLLVSKLRQDMAYNLAVLRQCLPETTEDLRMDAVLKCLLELYEAGTYKPNTNAAETLKVEDLDEMSKRSFPPCMRRLHEALRTKHHLRHSGRQQYQLFLKGAGLPMDECLRFWRSEFLKVVTPEKFDREHAYNIRHNYGQEGNRCNYSPYGCKKIIDSQPGPEDFHGCPFRHCKPTDLRRLVSSYGIDSKGLTEVLEHSDNHHYQIACQKLLVLTHEKGVEFGLTHPNQYYAESRQLITGVKVEKIAGATPSSNVNSPAVSATPGSANIPQNTPKPNPTASQNTPLSSKPAAQPAAAPTPTSRRSLPISKPTPNKTNDATPGVSDWLDEPDDDMMEQLIALETQ